MGKRALIGLLGLLIASSAWAVETKDLASGVTPDEMVTLLAGAGITISNAKVTGAESGAGTFTGGEADGLAVDSGVILSSGSIATAKGPNTSESTTGGGGAGDSDLNTLVSPLSTNNAVVLEFDAITNSSSFSIRYVFASEEYKEYVGSNFNDVFAFFVDGQNIAFVPNTVEPVTINTISHETNSALYNDNPAGSGTFGTSFDGFTVELIATATVTPGVPHHIKLAIADTTDSALDSAVFLAEGGISGAPVATAVIVDPGTLLMGNLEQADVDVKVYGVPEDKELVMSHSGLPEDSTVTFTRHDDFAFGVAHFTMRVRTGAEIGTGTHQLVINADIEGAVAHGTVLVVVDCDPPKIFGTPGNQPATQQVNRNARATLRVQPAGSGPFRYQWYRGYAGSTAFPIAGATFQEFQTPPVTGSEDYWVRVFNPCGSIDSRTATVSPR